MKVRTKIIKLFTNRGFYILLALGVGILGVTGYVNNLKNKASFEAPLTATSSPEAMPPKLSSVPAMAVSEESITPATRTSAVAVVTEQEDEKLMLPLQGELGTGFSIDELVFSVTMQDWRTHTGIDIRGDVGTPVKAAGSGVVKDVYEDEMMGTTVVILHPNGIETIYSNLQTAQLVETGQKVFRGDTIGGVGMTAQSEINEPPHLHFEIKKDSEFVNPFDFLY